MPASWGELFERGAEYGVDLETVRAATAELSTAESGERADSAGTAETEGDDA